MNLNEVQKHRILEFVENIFFDGILEGGGVIISSKNELDALNKLVFEQGSILLQYLGDITLDDVDTIKLEAPTNKIIKKGNK